MESLLIFIAIFVIDALIKRANAKKKSQEQQPPYRAPADDSSPEFENELNDEEFDERTDEDAPPAEKPFVARKLQEYIKQFEEAQREASQGTLEPAMPPIPERHHRMGNNVTMREVAEDIVQMDIVDIEYLMDEFGMSEGSAIEMLKDLQQHRIIGRDMGEGTYDILVHDIDELNNLLALEKAKQGPSATAAKPESAAASEKQNQLKILEERARKAREAAAAAARQSDIENGYTGEPTEIADPLTKRTSVRSISRESVRRGFIWGKVIDEPRFKKRWSPVSR